jgi:hypothetical protein
MDPESQITSRLASRIAKLEEQVTAHRRTLRLYGLAVVVLAVGLGFVGLDLLLFT